MKNRINIFILIFVSFLYIQGCENNELTTEDQTDFISTTTKSRPVASVSSALINADRCGETATTPLIAGQNIEAGIVSVSVNNGLLTVSYEAQNGWIITETQLHIAASVEGIPANKSGNPKIGNFEYKADHSPAVSTYTYSDIDVSGMGEITIAAHAVVAREAGSIANLEVIESIIPENLDITVAFTEHPSYLQATITNSGTLDGVFNCYCVDLDHGIMPGLGYSMSALSSLSSNTELLAKLVDQPENLDLINYIINQEYPELEVRGNEYQAIFWTLIDNLTPKSGDGSIEWNQEVVDAVIADAMQNGEGFVPGCEDEIFIIMNPGGNIEDPVIKSQVTIIQVPVSEFPDVCKTVYSDSETAWGQGVDFDGGSWAMYFKYCVDAPQGCVVDLDVVSDYIPAEKVNVVVNFQGNPSYFQTTITNGEALNGVFEGNCVDFDHGISSGKLHQMSIYSTYNQTLEFLGNYVDKPQNFDLVNYLVNTDYSALGATGSEEQAAIWSLIDDRVLASGSGGIRWDQSVVDQMVADAIANGEGFVPPCDGDIVFLLDPNPGHEVRFQVTLIKFPVAQIPNSTVGTYE